MKDNSLSKKARTVISTVLVVYVLTVAVNLGEFWPFSIYPMFSQGGNPWSRALVREIPVEDSVSWEVTDLSNLPGLPFSVKSHGADPIDLANFVSKTEVWSDVRAHALRIMLFGNESSDIQVMVYRVDGRLTENDDISVKATPYVLIGPFGEKVYTEIMK